MHLAEIGGTETGRYLPPSKLISPKGPHTTDKVATEEKRAEKCKHGDRLKRERKGCCWIACVARAGQGRQAFSYICR